MSEENNTESVEKTGSSDQLIQTDPAKDVNAGESAQKPASTTDDKGSQDKGPDYKSQYEELEKKFGEQGRETGELRDFFKDVSPLLDVLDENPDVVKAIMDGKLTPDLAKAALDGKLKVEEAVEVTKAHAEVKKDLGKKKYEESSTEDVEKLVESKMSEHRQSIDKRLSEAEELRSFEKGLDDFVSSTPDFPDYADAISQWFKDNPDQTNIKIAYDSVKGAALGAKAQSDEEKAKAEAEKNLAANAAGGASQGAQIVEDKGVVDDLISSSPNPNSFL